MARGSTAEAVIMDLINRAYADESLAQRLALVAEISRLEIEDPPDPATMSAQLAEAHGRAQSSLMRTSRCMLPGVPTPKQPCIDVLTLVALQPASFVTDAEIFQEILPRYRAIGRWHEGAQLFRGFAALLHGRVADMTLSDVEMAARTANSLPGLGARDLLHLAILRRVGASSIVTADTAFDAVQGIQRLAPSNIDSW